MTIDNDIGLPERTLAALGRPAWIDRVFGDLAVKGRATSTRRGYVQIFKEFHCPGRRHRARTTEVACTL
ncbi:hypothetical protein [Streptomyces sp. NPDC047000]|uniref:hypothetical protein n=1 Tax=Streptomyces sp. NPDC047000 TaxID=3155474 RepID=UPI0033FF9F0C